MSQSSPEQVRPPYLSYKSLRNFLDSLKASGVPGRLDRSVLPSSMSGTIKVYVLAALRFFRLMSESGMPQDTLNTLVMLEGAERAKFWQKIFFDAYNPIIDGMDITRATTKMVDEKFKESGLSGDSVRKAITFFIHAAKDADIKVSSHIKAYGGQQRGRRPAITRNNEAQEENGNGRRSVETPPPAPPMGNKSPYQVLIEILSPDMQEDEQQAVWTLIRYLKKKEAETKTAG